MDIFIGSEYGRLKEAIVGLAIGMNPSAEAEWLKDALKDMPEEARAEAEQFFGKSYSEQIIDKASGKSVYAALNEECEALIALLRKLKVRVYRPNELKNEDIVKLYGAEALKSGYSQSFPRDSIAIIGNTVIETNLRSPARKVDIEGLRSLLAQKCGGRSVRWVAMPHAQLLGLPSFDTPILSGRDVMTVGKTVLVGCSINPAVGSNMAGYLWLKGLLGDEYNVLRVPLNENAPHLDTALSIPREGFAILCPEAFNKGIPEPIQDFDIVEAWPDLLQYLAINGLPVDSENYIIGYDNLCDNYELYEELTKRGIKAHKLFFGAHIALGGSIRSATAALLRMD